MPLSDLFVPAAWAIMPGSLDSLLQMFSAAPPEGADPARPDTPAPAARAASPFAAPDASGPADAYFLRDGVAVIEISGIIRRASGSFLWFFWEGQDRIRASIKTAMEDPAARAILLSFDSPGGVAAGVKELADYIASLTAKPIYAYADGLCASAAYWLASATGRVYAPLTATIGSIGVLHVHCDRSAANTAAGVRYTYITGGAWKAAGNPDAPLSGADQAHLQTLVNTLHGLFRADVASRMPVDALSPESWGDG